MFEALFFCNNQSEHLGSFHTQRFNANGSSAFLRYRRSMQVSLNGISASFIPIDQNIAFIVMPKVQVAGQPEKTKKRNGDVDKITRLSPRLETIDEKMLNRKINHSSHSVCFSPLLIQETQLSLSAFSTSMARS